ncbi:MAG: HAMP domain-containing histidine kinase [Bdellovibrionales bacterium]|nr:HAMP domain-containing histidine kinase [Bdellovibrionales bacterium]
MVSNPSAKDFAELYQEIAEEAMMGFITFDTSSNTCVYANKLARELLELGTCADLNTIKVYDLYPSEPDAQGRMRPLEENLIQLEGLFQDILVKKLNGHTFIANIGIKKVHMANEDHLLLMLQDMTIQHKLQKEITEKQTAIKAAYEEVLNQNRQLKELDVAKDKFIALTTHELRTPLAAMFGSAEILHYGMYDTEEELKEFINMIYSQGKHMMELVNDILDFAKAQAGRTDYFIEQLNLSEFVEEQMTNIETMAIENQVKMDFRFQKINALCYFDPLRLKQVMQNILSNAIKYNRDGGTVYSWLEEYPHFIRVYIQDTGHGIEPENIRKVFNEFETLGKVANHHKGTGLGMPITLRLVEGMGGKIDLLSDVGKGTTFWIDIPKEKVLKADVYKERPLDVDDLLAS